MRKKSKKSKNGLKKGGIQKQLPVPSSSSSMNDNNGQANNDHKDNASAVNEGREIATTTMMEDSQKTTSVIDERKLLADSFVPQHLKRLNLMAVKYVIPTQPTPTHHSMLMQCQAIYSQLCAMPPPPPFPNNKHVVLPWLRVPQLPLEHDFALSEASQQRKSPDFRVTFQAVEEVSSLQEYVLTFRKLLREELETILLLYERYSRYQERLIYIPKERSKNSTTHDYSKEPQPKEYDYYAKLHIPGIYDARPPVIPGDSVLLRPHVPIEIVHPGVLDWIEVHATVIQTVRNPTKGDEIIVSWSKQLSHLPPKTLLTARFLPSVSYFQRCLTALNWLSTCLREEVARDLLFPTKAPQIPSPPPGAFVDPSLNSQQSDFVQMALARTRHPSFGTVRPPLILTGPAGTGKTKALLMAILECLKQNDGTNITATTTTTTTTASCSSTRVLVCTPSHTAADVMARRLASSAESSSRSSSGFSLGRSDLFRLYDMNRPISAVPVELLPFTRQGADGEFILPPPAELMQFKVIVCTCSDAHLLYCSGLTNAQLRARRECLQLYCLQILSQSQMEATIHGADQIHFTHLVVDEAAQATEPELLIPFSVVVDDAPNVQKVECILAGDPRQLSPDIYSSHAHGLRISLLERLLRLPEGGGRKHLLGPPTKDTWRTMDELLEYSFQRRESQHPYLSVFLSQSYRGHPSFLHMPSKLFYHDKLQSAVMPNNNDAETTTTQLLWLSRRNHLRLLSSPAYLSTNNSMEWPIHFCGVRDGRDMSVAIDSSIGGSNSWNNPQEASMIAKMVECLVQKGDVLTQSIGIMAAFRVQVVLIREILRKRNLGGVNVGMVEDYQAVERDVILLSLTRSNEAFVSTDLEKGVGLLQQPKRINVALTRAEHLLIVVGNPATMYKDPIWKEWLNYCKEYGFWYGDAIVDDDMNT